MLGRLSFAICTAGALLLPIFAAAGVTVADRLAPDQPIMVVMGSKAADTGFPEQSLAGFAWAIERGVDAIVVATQRTRDGQYIVMNDATLPRTTTVRDVYPDGPPSRDAGDMVAGWHLIADYTLEEMSPLRLRDPQGGDHPVPTLDEALDLVDGRALVIIKIDSYDADALAALLNARDTGNLLLFSWGDKTKLGRVAQATGSPIWDTLLGEKNPLAALEAQSDRYGAALRMIDVDPDQMSPELVATADALDVDLCLDGDVEDAAMAEGDPAPWRAVLDSPVSAYSTKYPAALMDLLGR